MTINLSKDLERIVHDAVRAGLYAREDDVIRDALNRLWQAMPKDTPMARKRQATKPPAQEEAAHARRAESTVARIRPGQSASRSRPGYRRR